MPGKKYPFWIWFEIVFEQVWFGAIVWFWRGVCWRHAEGKWVGVSKENWCPGQKCSSKLKVGYVISESFFSLAQISKKDCQMTEGGTVLCIAVKVAVFYQQVIKLTQNYDFYDSLC